jgi:hypothetical protein
MNKLLYEIGKRMMTPFSTNNTNSNDSVEHPTVASGVHAQYFNNMPFFYLTYVTLLENAGMLAAKAVTLATMGRLLFRARFTPSKLRRFSSRGRLSIAMLTYLGTHVFCSVFSVPCVYYILFFIFLYIFTVFFLRIIR